MNLVRMWCVMNMACCAEIAATSIKTNLKPPVLNKCHSSHCYQGNRPVQNSNVVNYQTDSPIRDSDTRLCNFTSESSHRSTSRYGRPIRFPAKYRDFVVS